MAALRRKIEHTPPTLPEGAPSEALKRDFGRRLYRLMINKGWNQSDLARAAEKYMADGKFGRDNVSGYVRGKRLPGPVHLSALAKALGVDVNDLLSMHATTPAEKYMPEFDMKSIGDGKVWLRVNQPVPWEVARKVMDLLNE